MASFDQRLNLTWRDVLPALLSSTGVLLATILAVGWLHLRGYYGYYTIPIGAVDLGNRDFAAAIYLHVTDSDQRKVYERAWEGRRSQENAKQLRKATSAFPPPVLLLR